MPDNVLQQFSNACPGSRCKLFLKLRMIDLPGTALFVAMVELQLARYSSIHGRNAHNLPPDILIVKNSQVGLKKPTTTVKAYTHYKTWKFNKVGWIAIERPITTGGKK